MIYNFVQVITDKRISFFFFLVDEWHSIVYLLYFLRLSHLATEVDVVVNAGVTSAEWFALTVPSGGTAGNTDGSLLNLILFSSLVK